jgi:hypothetical protein
MSESRMTGRQTESASHHCYRLGWLEPLRRENELLAENNVSSCCGRYDLERAPTARTSLTIVQSPKGTALSGVPKRRRRAGVPPGVCRLKNEGSQNSPASEQAEGKQRWSSGGAFATTPWGQQESTRCQTSILRGCTRGATLVVNANSVTHPQEAEAPEPLIRI